VSPLRSRRCSSSTVAFLRSPRVHQELAAAACQVGRHRVARLMVVPSCSQNRKAFSLCRQRQQSASAGATENLVQQDFSSGSQSQAGGETSRISRTRAVAVPAVLIGSVFSRPGRRIGNSTAVDKTALVDRRRLNRALGHRQVEPEKLLIISDQGKP